MRNSMIEATNKQTNEKARFVVPSKNVDNFIELLDDVGAEYKVYEVGQMPLKELPEEVQAKVKETLTVFEKAFVTFEFNRFSVSSSVCIRASYNYDHFVCGTYYSKDVYTEEERRQHLAELNSYEFPEWAW